MMLWAIVLFVIAAYLGLLLYGKFASQSMTTNSSVIRGIETFVIVLVAQFIIAITALGHPVDINTAVGQGEILTALVAAFGMALRASQTPVIGAKTNADGTPQNRQAK